MNNNMYVANESDWEKYQPLRTNKNPMIQHLLAN